ncbi:MAG: DUF58 domain-containing protein [Streptosporangiaceae bacterium]|jgi:uncharacterized protein (DUF58 family)
MRTVFGALTTRGKCFIAAGITAALCGLGIPEPDLVRVGALLLVLPLLSAMGASRARYRLSCARSLNPRRVPVGASVTVTLRLTNVSRLRTGLLLAEDTIPYGLTGRPGSTVGAGWPGGNSTRPRFLLDRIEPSGYRDYSYQVRSDSRGRFTLGPLQLRVADSFGLVEIGRAFAATSTLTVTPRIVPLDQPALAGNWPGEGDRGRRTISASGEDDVAPRAYRDGDSLHRVHWRSTARYGELMVRREEQHWRNSATLFLDTRRSSYSSTGPDSTFEFAVSAAASIGVHLSGEGFDARFVTAEGEVGYQGTFQDTLLDTLAVISPSRQISLRGAITALTGKGVGKAGGGQIIAVLAHLTDEEARQLAGTRRGGAPTLALLLGSTSGRVTTILTQAGWRVASAPMPADLPEAWRQVRRPAAPAPPASSFPAAAPIPPAG